MELQRLDTYKAQFKELAPKIGTFQSYLDQKSKAGENIVLPYQVCQTIGLDETAALFLLTLAEKEHLVTKMYSVFSDEDNLIGEYDAQSKIPPTIREEASGKVIDRDHYYVQISFLLES